MKRVRKKIGDIVEIHVHKEYFCYAQVIQTDRFAFFDFKTNEPLNDYAILDTCKVLFELCVYRYVLSKGIWTIVGNRPVRKELLSKRMEYVYDKFTGRFSLYNTKTGEMTPATKEKAKGLERCAVWGDNHVEDRIDDYYCNRPCIWLKEDYELWEQ